MSATAMLTWDVPTETVVPGHHSGSADDVLLAWDAPVESAVPNNHSDDDFTMSWDEIA
ncbi:MAG TPA: hypothetical protein VGL02_09800 [Streptomyces sp.]|jgi:hypothetical protein|uniref:hypothetical protein n=1 Tax=Streptomyces sp. NPDC051976 TaxID=3154947 RepID=UPI002F82CA5E